MEGHTLECDGGRKGGRGREGSRDSRHNRDTSTTEVSLAIPIIHTPSLLQLVPTDGVIRKHAHLRIGRYHQHLKDQLDLSLSALQYVMKCYPEEKEEEDMRRALGMYGLTGKQQVCVRSVCVHVYVCVCACDKSVMFKACIT